MVSLTQSSARTPIDVAEAAEIARMARTGDPNILSRDSMEALLGNSALVLDGLRRRPRYFDGRFLTGADMTRDQDYIRQRQADLARASGVGVVNGLEVGITGSPGGEMLTITPGHGITPSGDIVTVMTRRTIAPLDLPAVERLDASLGLRLAPAVPLGRRTGLFLLVLRAVEFTANPIAAYPTSITGPRRVEDGDVIEATAITLVPYPDTGSAGSLAEARRGVVRRVFLGEAEGMPQEALPLAMIAMERGAIRWIDTALVRRETGADTPLQVSMGARPRALSEAFVLQHRRHLHDVLRERAVSGLPPVFSAMQYFSALPAAGQLPATAVLTDPLGFRQVWFPPAVDVDLSFVPHDEIAALVEESLAMPPIDLLADPLDLDATGVVVFAPVTRPRLQRFEQALSQLALRAQSDPGQGIRRAPADMLAALLARRGKYLEAAQRDADAEARAAAADAETRTWQTAWAEAVAALPTEDGLPPLLWYVRRRSVPYASRVAGIAVAVSGDDERLTNTVDARLRVLGLEERVAAIAAGATPFAEARIFAFLGAPVLMGSVALMGSAVHDLELAMPIIIAADTVPGGGDTVADGGDTAPTRPAPGETPPIIVAPPASLRLDAPPTLSAAASIRSPRAVNPDAPPVFRPAEPLAGPAEPTPTSAPRPTPESPLEDTRVLAAAASLTPARVASTASVTGAAGTSRTGTSGGIAAALTAARAPAATISPALAAAIDRGTLATAVTRSGLARLASFRLIPPNTRPLDKLSDGDVIDVASDYADPRLGEGLTRIDAALGEDAALSQAAALWIGGTGLALDLDRAAREVSPANLPAFVTELAEVTQNQDTEALSQLIANVV
jgi:hypothetical protein